MTYKTHTFTDAIGGTFKYLDKPDRLDDLLTADTNKRSKILVKSANDNLKEQITWYVNHIIDNSVKDLIFWPLKKNMASYPNKFRYGVLERLNLPHTPINYIPTNTGRTDRLRQLEQLALAAGFTITEYHETDNTN